MVSGVTQTVAGAYQFIKGDKMEKRLGELKEYEIPEEIYTNMSLADQIAFEGMPEEQRMQMLRDIRRSRAAAISRAGSLNASMSGLAAAQIAEGDALAQINTQDALMRLQGRKGQMKARQVMAEYKDQKYAEYKENWMRQWQTAQALKGAGLQNVVGGIDMTSSSAGSMNSTGDQNTDTRSEEGESGKTGQNQQKSSLYDTALDPSSFNLEFGFQ